MAREAGDRESFAYATLWLGMLDGVEAGYHAESVAVFRELGDDEGLAHALWLWGVNSRDSGNLAQAEILLNESERLYQQMGSWRLGEIYYNLGQLYAIKRQLQQARSLFLQALTLLVDVDDQWNIMFCKTFFGWMELAEADDEASLRNAEALLLESLETAQKFGKGFWLNFTIPLSLGKEAKRQGDYPRAMGWLREALALAQSFGWKAYENPQFEVVPCLLVLSETAVYLDGAATGARLLGALDGLRDSWDRLWIKPADFQSATQAVQAVLGEAEYTRLFTLGQALTLEQAVALALEGDG
jgi:tetratricopeptide (TPR) repeat protein